MKNTQFKLKKMQKRPMSGKKDTITISNKQISNINSQKQVLTSSINDPRIYKRTSSKVMHTQADNYRPATAQLLRSQTIQNIELPFLTQQQAFKTLKHVQNNYSQIKKLISENFLNEQDIKKINQDIAMKLKLGFINVDENYDCLQKRLKIKIQRYAQNKKSMERYNASQCKIQQLLSKRLDKLKEMKAM